MKCLHQIEQIKFLKWIRFTLLVWTCVLGLEIPATLSSSLRFLTHSFCPKYLSDPEELFWNLSKTQSMSKSECCSFLEAPWPTCYGYLYPLHLVSPVRLLSAFCTFLSLSSSWQNLWSRSMWIYIWVSSVGGVCGINQCCANSTWYRRFKCVWTSFPWANWESEDKLTFWKEDDGSQDQLALNPQYGL